MVTELLVIGLDKTSGIINVKRGIFGQIRYIPTLSGGIFRPSLL
jgi:hypothetical protein